MAAFAQSSRLASPALRSLIARRLATLAALLLAGGGLVLLVALGSFDPLDPSFNTATMRRAHNLLGTPGALFADILLQGFGIAGGLPGVALLAWAWGAGVRGRIDGGTLLLRAVALLVTLPVVAAVASGVAGGLALGPAWPTAAGPGTADGRGPTTGAADRQGWIRSAIERVVAAIRGAIRKVTSRRHR